MVGADDSGATVERGNPAYLVALRQRMASFADMPIAFVTGGPISMGDTAECSPDDLARGLADLQRLAGQVEAEIARLVSHVERRAIHGHDGHARPHGWVRANATTGSGRAREIVERSRLIGAHPWVGEALWSGRLAIAHVDILAKAYTNPRVRLTFGDFEATFLAFAREYTLAEYALLVAHWVSRADADGADQTKRAADESRYLRFGLDADGRFSIEGQAFGAQAVELNEILSRMAQAERLADWEDARKRVGEDATALDLARTARQRNLDALHALALQAVESPPGSKAPAPVVNIVVDMQTLREWLDHLDGRDPLTPASLRRRLCHTIDGVPIDPATLLTALIEGNIRVIGIDAARNPVAISSLQRCFSPALRDVLRLLTPTCVWPGCERPVSTTQTDHMHPWVEGGATEASNGAPMCEHHNRWRHRHRYRVWKDPAGGFHTFRSDGTEVHAA